MSFIFTIEGGDKKEDSPIRKGINRRSRHQEN
jgi:hypothetical protein